MMWVVGILSFVAGYGFAIALGRFHDEKVSRHYLEVPRDVGD